jgi:hypothetical protein
MANNVRYWPLKSPFNWSHYGRISRLHVQLVQHERPKYMKLRSSWQLRGIFPWEYIVGHLGMNPAPAYRTTALFSIIQERKSGMEGRKVYSQIAISESQIRGFEMSNKHYLILSAPPVSKSLLVTSPTRRIFVEIYE